MWPKDPDGDTIFELFQLVASPQSTADLRSRYQAGGLPLHRREA